MIEDILALIVNKIITDDLKQNPRVNVGSWAYLATIKADFLIGFNHDGTHRRSIASVSWGVGSN